eukprot:1849-Heterococcus_DN1.PRE.2
MCPLINNQLIAELHVHASPLHQPHGSSVNVAFHAVALLLQEMRSGSSSGGGSGSTSSSMPITSLPQLQSEWAVNDNFLKANCALWVKKGHEALFNSMWSRMTANAKERVRNLNTLNTE